MTRLLPAACAVASAACFLAATTASSFVLTLEAAPAEAASSVRFVQVMSGGTSVGVLARGSRVDCVSAVTGKAAATVTVAVDGRVLWSKRLVPARTETGCVGPDRFVRDSRSRVVVTVGSDKRITSLR